MDGWIRASCVLETRRLSTRPMEGLRVDQDQAHGTVFSLDGPPPAHRRREMIATRERDASTVLL